AAGADLRVGRRADRQPAGAGRGGRGGPSAPGPGVLRDGRRGADLVRAPGRRPGPGQARRDAGPGPLHGAPLQRLRRAVLGSAARVVPSCVFVVVVASCGAAYPLSTITPSPGARRSSGPVVAPSRPGSVDSATPPATPGAAAG